MAEYVEIAYLKPYWLFPELKISSVYGRHICHYKSENSSGNQDIAAGSMTAQSLSRSIENVRKSARLQVVGIGT